MERHPLSERFHELLARCGELHDRKQSDYGREGDPFANIKASEDFGLPAWVGAIVRANDKMRRLQKAAKQVVAGEDVSMENESIEDSFFDLAVYALIAQVLFEEEIEALTHDDDVSPTSYYDVLETSWILPLRRAIDLFRAERGEAPIEIQHHHPALPAAATLCGIPVVEFPEIQPGAIYLVGSTFRRGMEVRLDD